MMNDIPEGIDIQARYVSRSTSGFCRVPVGGGLSEHERVEVVCLQHEFGIFGGDNGVHVLDLLGGLRMPLVTTCTR